MIESRLTDFKMSYEIKGGHAHVNVWLRTPPTETWACAGSLAFSDNYEFWNWRVRMERANIAVEYKT